jgi:Protein of unknown function (DUF2911)
MVRKAVPVAVVLVLAALSVAFAQNNKPPASPRGEASISFADGKKITVDYGRPYMRNRKIMGELVPYGKVWRTGANAATGFVTDAAITIGGTSIPAGKYTMYTVPGENEWRIVINKQTGQWGTEYHEEQDFARILAQPSKLPQATDQFTISFEKRGPNAAIMKMEWENTSVAVDIAEANK